MRVSSRRKREMFMYYKYKKWIGLDATHNEISILNTLVANFTQLETLVCAFHQQSKMPYHKDKVCQTLSIL